MKNYKSGEELKAEIKFLYSKNWWRAIGAVVPVTILVLVMILLAIIGLVYSTSYTGVFLIDFIVWCLSFVDCILVNIARCYIWDWLDKKARPQHLLSKKYFLGNIFITGFISLSMLAVDIVVTTFACFLSIFMDFSHFKSYYVFMLIVFFIFMTIGIVILNSYYSAAVLIFKSEIDAGQTRTSYFSYLGKSRRLMRGHKHNYFALLLSMSGWYGLFFLGLVVCSTINGAVITSYGDVAAVFGLILNLSFYFIFMLFFKPYVYGVTTNFWYNLLQNYSPK